MHVRDFHTVADLEKEVDSLTGKRDELDKTVDKLTKELEALKDG